jgi:sulfite exporter TauE/SafE
MLLFGAGTVPVLFVVGMGAGTLSVRVRQVLSRVAGLLIVVVGIQLVLRGMAGLDVISHLKVGELMLW